MRGGVVPLSCQQLQGLISAVQVEMGTFPIQSQHEGNCASDAIQIILYFSDGIGMQLSTTAITEYRAGVYTNDIYNEEGIRQGLKDVGPAGGPNLGTAYGRITAVRFLRLIDEYYSLLDRIQYRERPQTMYRAPSRSRLNTTTLRRQLPVGVMCSAVFAISQQSIGNAAEIFTRTKRNELYPYSPAVYDPIVADVLNKFAPGSELQSGSISRIEQRYNPEEWKAVEEVDRRNRVSGVQLFCIEGPKEDGSHRGFHTFSLFRRNGVWYIGDNEVGLAVTITPALTIGDILTHRISFHAVMIDRSTKDRRLYEYSRTYYKQRVLDDWTLGESIQIAQANYFLKDATSGPYNTSYEDVMHMPRKYFLAPPGAPNCPGPGGMGGRRRKTYRNRR